MLTKFAGGFHVITFLFRCVFEHSIDDKILFSSYAAIDDFFDTNGDVWWPEQDAVSVNWLW